MLDHKPSHDPPCEHWSSDLVGEVHEDFVDVGSECVKWSGGGVGEQVLQGDLGRGGTELALFVAGRLSERMGAGRETCHTRLTASVEHTH